MNTTDTTALPDYAPVPRSALGPALNEQGYYVGRVERNLYWITDGAYQAAFLTTKDGVVLFDAPPTLGHNLQRAIDEIASANGVSNTVSQGALWGLSGLFADEWRAANNSAPAGTSRSGLSATMNSAWAMLVCWMAVKKSVMLRPKKSPAGTTRRHVAAEGGRRPVTTRRPAITTHHSSTAPINRQNATTEPGASAHFTTEELLEKASTAPSTQAMPRTVRSGVRSFT